MVAFFFAFPPMERETLFEHEARSLTVWCALLRLRVARVGGGYGLSFVLYRVLRTTVVIYGVCKTKEIWQKLYRGENRKFIPCNKSEREQKITYCTFSLPFIV